MFSCQIPVPERVKGSHFVLSFFLLFTIPVAFGDLPTTFGGKEPHLRRWLVSPLSWGFPGLSLALRQMLGYLCTAPGVISLLSLSLADRRDTRTSGLWSGICATPTLAWSFCWPQLMVPCTSHSQSWSLLKENMESDIFRLRKEP